MGEVSHGGLKAKKRIFNGGGVDGKWCGSI